MNTKVAKASLNQGSHDERGFQSLNDAVTLAVGKVGTAIRRDGDISGISTGISALDIRTGGLHPCDLIILAGQPGMDKTSLVTHIAYSIAANHQKDVASDVTKAKKGGVVGFYSLTFSSEELAISIISQQTRISQEKIRRGDITEAEFDKLVAHSKKMKEVPLYIDETGGISLSQLSARARRLKRQRGLDVLIVDYMQLLLPQSASGKDDKTMALARLASGLKDLAKELNISIVATFQTSNQDEFSYENNNFLQVEMDKMVVDFVVIIDRSTSSNGVKLSFLEKDQSPLLNETYNGVYSDNPEGKNYIDISEYVSRKIKDWDQSIKRIDSNLSLFYASSEH